MGSAFEVNVSSAERRRVERAIKDAESIVPPSTNRASVEESDGQRESSMQQSYRQIPANCLDRVHNEVFSLIENDVLPRFLKSPAWATYQDRVAKRPLSSTAYQQFSNFSNALSTHFSRRSTRPDKGGKSTRTTRSIMTRSSLSSADEMQMESPGIELAEIYEKS